MAVGVGIGVGVAAGVGVGVGFGFGPMTCVAALMRSVFGPFSS